MSRGIRQPRPGSRLAGFALLVAAALLLLFASGRAAVTTDLFALLPKEQRDPVLAQAMAQSRDAFFDRVDIAIHAPRTHGDAARQAAARVVAALGTAPLRLDSASEQHAQLGQVYAAYPFQWLTPADRAALRADPETFFRQRVAANLARPGNFKPQDPAGLLAAWLGTLPAPAANWTLLGDFPARVTDDGIAIYLGGTLTRSAMDPETQSALDNAFAAARASMSAACTSCELHWTGAVRFSEATRTAAQADIQRLSLAATLGIMLLFALAFRSVKPLLAALVVLGGGVAAGLAASFAVFGELHALTLVFGTTLLGLCVDYVLHYLVHRWAHPSQDAAAALDAVRPGMALGLLTSVTAFGFLLFAGFPALGQLAVFAASGLLTAFAMVCLWLPWAVAAPAAGNPLARIVSRSPRLPGRARLAAVLALAVAAAIGLPSLQVVDDVRGLQSIPDALAADDARVRDLTRHLPGRAGADFHIVEGDSLDAALERERTAFENANAFGLSRFLLSRDARAANRAAHAPLFDGEPSIAARVLAELGFDPRLARDLRTAYRAGHVPDTAALLESPGLRELAALHVSTANGAALVARAADSVQAPNVRHIEPLAEVQATFAAIRWRALLAVGGGYLLMLAILVRRYGLRDGARVLAPALLGAGCAVGLLGLFGLPLNVFSMIALILVLGIGADYALFLREGRDFAGTARLATGCAALTSLLSFGLLFFSHLDALRAFGFTAAAGVFVAWLAAPFALRTAIAQAAQAEVVHERAA